MQLKTKTERKRVVFVFDLSEEDAISETDLNDWAREMNDTMAAYVIGYEGWRVEDDEPTG